MNSVRAYYDGAAFVTIEPCNIPKGVIVRLAVSKDDPIPIDEEIVRRLAALERITNNLRELDESEPLPPEFDEIMSKRVNFAGKLDL